MQVFTKTDLIGELEDVFTRTDNDMLGEPGASSINGLHESLTVTGAFSECR